MQRWNDKIAVVTGAGAGMGAAIAQKLVENGLQVVGLDIRQDKLNELETRLGGGKGKFVGRTLDVTNTEHILETFEWINQNVGPISILVNNAGVTAFTTIVNGDIAAWKRILDTNVLGLTVASRQAIESMRENNINGQIININSVNGHEIFNFPNQHVYPASKYAVTAFTATLRKELVQSFKSRIRVTSLSPGAVNTDFINASGLASNVEFKKSFDENPKLSPEDIADAVLYILGTPESVNITELTIKPTGEPF